MTWFFLLFLAAMGVTPDNAQGHPACDLVVTMSAGAVSCDSLYRDARTADDAKAPTSPHPDQAPGLGISNGF